MPELNAVKEALAQMLAESPGGRLHLAQVGAKLRERFPDFNPSAYGQPSLKALLLAVPEVGRLEGQDPGTWELVRAVPRLVPGWWKAVTEFDPDRRTWFDLGEEMLEVRESEVAREPARYLELPRVGVEMQRQIALTWAEELDSELREPLVLVLQESQRLEPFLQEVRRLGLFEEWSRHRTWSIVSQVLAWAEEHGIDKARMLDTASRVERAPRSPHGTSYQTPRPQAPSPYPLSEHELRLFLHHAIDHMSLEELGKLWIPARLLARPPER